MTATQKLGTNKHGQDVYGYEPLTVRVEVWPVAADDAGIWLVNDDDAWRSLPLRTDTEPHQAVEFILNDEGASANLIHSPSWRLDEASIMLTYIAVISYSTTSVREEWPDARPISMELMRTVGKPLPTEPTTPPLPRYIDVLHHGVRHLRFLLDTDAAARSALNQTWRNHLAQLEPSLSGMYE